MATDRARPTTRREQQIENTEKQIAQYRDELARGMFRSDARLESLLERILAGTPVVLVEGDIVEGGLGSSDLTYSVVRAAPIGSLHIRKQGTIEIKLPTGWRSANAARDDLTEEKLDKLPRELVSMLYEAADAELLKQIAFVELLARVNKRQV